MTTSREYRTEQEDFWAGDFGKGYMERNQGDFLLAANLNFFSKALKFTRGINTCIEFGANIGMNLKALRLLFPNLEACGVEINTDAAKQLALEIGEKNVFNESIFDYLPQRAFDLALIKGVLIHINPDQLDVVYSKIYESSAKYVLVAEYYNPTPVAIPYRGHTNKLFKRDFAGEFLDSFPRLKLLDYGFAYKRDPGFPQDDITWFLMERNWE